MARVETIISDEARAELRQRIKATRRKRQKKAAKARRRAATA